MSKFIPYSYTVLRYVHDITTGEFVNVGVAIYAPEARYASAICRSTYGRLSRLFPGLNAEHFKALMRHIQTSFEELGERLETQLPLESASSVIDLARRILPTDDSSLQWAPMGFGRTVNPQETLEKLYDRMVMRYEERSVRKHKTEEDVWRHFKRTLESRHLLQHFEPNKITVQDDELNFQHTWKNGILHCLEAVSFDLSSPESIRDKAHRWLGRVTSVAKSTDRFRLYFLVGQPQDEELIAAFENAVSILNKIPTEKMIFYEEQTEELSNIIAQEVAMHEGRALT